MEHNYCKFIFNEQIGKCKCYDCGYETIYCNAKKYCLSKPQPQLERPSLINRVTNFVAAVTQHAIAGNPTVSEKTMKERLAICKECPLFKLNTNAVGGVCTHETCGCNVQDNLNYLNKIAWADQKCPIDKWGKVDPGV